MHKMLKAGAKQMILSSFSCIQSRTVKTRDPLSGLRVVKYDLLRNWIPKTESFDIEAELNHHNVNQASLNPGDTDRLPYSRGREVPEKRRTHNLAPHTNPDEPEDV